MILQINRKLLSISFLFLIKSRCIIRCCIQQVYNFLIFHFYTISKKVLIYKEFVDAFLRVFYLLHYLLLFVYFFIYLAKLFYQLFYFQLNLMLLLLFFEQLFQMQSFQHLFLFLLQYLLIFYYIYHCIFLQMTKNHMLQQIFYILVLLNI